MIDLSSHKKRNVLVVDSNIRDINTANGRAVNELIIALNDINFNVIAAATFEDGAATVISDSSLCCIFVDWTSGGNDDESHSQAFALLQDIRRRNKSVPVLLMAEHSCINSLSLETMQLVNEFVWMHEDTSEFIAARAKALIIKYYQQLLPPFTQALFQYTQDNPEYSWAAPGHQGGVAFSKTAVGREFLDFFGENLFRTDTGIERESLGSLLDHSGPIKESEAYAAQVFGAHASYSMLNGTSGSNRAIMAAVVGDKQIALCDRNCHKSIEQGLVLSGALPVFFIPTRNRYGIIGPIPKAQFQPTAIAQKIEQNPLKSLACDSKPVYAVITNCTYDGMCYNAQQAQDLLAKSVDQIHFDEAWYAYARFNPLYRERFAMRGDPADHDALGPTIFATQSTHKLLAALSQASYIHVRNGKKPIEHSRFNESYMLQSTTSPLYAIIAANEVGAAMMEGGQGLALTQEVIDEAVDFRLALARAHDAFAKQGEWFFKPWNTPEITDSKSGKKLPFSQASREQLTTDPACWVLKPGDPWHGFEQLEEDWCMLDPIKAGIMVPGMGDDGKLSEKGIPAAIVTAFLGQRGIVPSRTTDFMVLCLFSVGVTKGKWGTLINVLLEFKQHYDSNTPISVCLPDLAKNYPHQYAHKGLKVLCDEMFAYMKISEMDKLQAEAFSHLPTPVVLPRQAFQDHMAGRCELLPIDKLAGRVSAVGVIPYPPGIPIVMPGESFGSHEEPWLRYILSITKWGQHFPGFEKILEGSEQKNGQYFIWVLKQ
ncbi:arginine decarboxylase [Yersinia pestis]|uniref:Amino acid decarboxylase n=12 Tax=Yersinia pestis TaxID=632 RepID=A0AAX2HZU2_YERPE|nr:MULTISPECIES: Orn/Lys/Arg decarboxylase N-terminal domain-containing protein [Yersinia pseudotuberculosis complex]EDR32346.1 biodegradative arginine decarboxylase [Yersinia pestis biovar Orientalis str. IP275]EFA46457.1 Orn/Lys/Arg decarboxylase, major domain protein [Yersinia pestis KIM D27]ERP75814.1 arginine decarboxylase [Yersinia pestis S3]AAM86538.1 biodegradative arginine decarboxylase [Yersinia pestis KIM10+]AAS61191.1 putative amino acid decarboxylase [Yersinia pestis biovar Microt